MRGGWNRHAEQARELEIDLRKRWFGSIRAYVSSAGRPLPGFVVEARPAASAHYFETSPPTLARGRTAPTHWIGATTRDDGTAVLEFVTPGQWSLRLMPSDGLRLVPTPEVVQVHAGTEALWAVDAGPISVKER